MNNLTCIQKNHIKLMIGFLLIILILLTYWNIQNCNFVGVDDELYVTQNRQVQNGLTFEGVVWAFTTFHSANWHPITWFSHMLDCQLYGLNPMGHHWTNLQFHMVNSLLLFFILFKMTGALWRSAFVSALFALHPLHVESVAWVSERKDVLSTFFGLLTILSYHRYIKHSRIINYLLIMLFLSLGLMAKPMLVTLPFILILLDFWPLGRLSFNSSQSFKEVFKRGFHLIREKLWLFIPVFISSVLTFWAQHNQGAVGSLTSYPISARISNVLVSYIVYFYKVIWPRKLAVFYPYPDFIPAWQVIGAALLIAVGCYLAVRYSKQYAYLVVGLFWYLGTLIPVIGLVQVGEQAMADRYMYIPSIGIFIIAAWGGWNLIKKLNCRKIILPLSTFIILSSLGVRTYFQVNHWKNGVSLFKNAVKVTKNNYWAYNNLGTAYGEKNYDKAISSYKKALKIKPEYIDALFNAGTAFMEKKSFDKAILYFNKALKIDPDFIDANINLGNIFFIQGKINKAILHYNKILGIDPENADAQSNLANVLTAQGKFDEAVFHYEQAIKIDPEHKDAHYNFGKLLIKKGRIKEAVKHFAEAIKIDPDYVKAYNYLGVIFARQGDNKKADMFFERAIQIKPDYIEARTNLKILKQIVSNSNLQTH